MLWGSAYRLDCVGFFSLTDIMFKRVLLCHDGTEYGRRALKQGAELAIALGSEVHVLIVIREQSLTPELTAASLGHVCIVEAEADYGIMVAQSIERLRGGVYPNLPKVTVSCG